MTRLTNFSAALILLLAVTPACAQQPAVQWQAINQTINNMQQQLNQIQAMVNNGLPPAGATGGQFLLQGATGPKWFSLSGDLNCSTTVYGNCTDVHFTLTSNSSAGSNKITSLAAGTVAGDALSYGQTAAQIQGLTSVTGQSASATISNFSVNGVFNVKDPKYGAKGDGSTDDTVAIQAAINAAETASSASVNPTIYFPAGSYKTTQPLVVTSQTAQAPAIIGAGQEASLIAATSGGTYPEIVYEGSGYQAQIGTFTATSLLTGGGVAMNWPNQVNGWWFDFNDLNQGNGAAPFNSAGAWNGKSAFTWESAFKYPSATLTNGHRYYITASGGVNGGDGISAASTFIEISILMNATPALKGCFTLSDGGGTQHCITYTNAAVSADTTHIVQLNYDSTTGNIYLILDGNIVNDSSAGNPLNVAGNPTLVQKPYEHWLVGDAPFGQWNDNWGGNGQTHWIGQQDSIRISNIARNIANYTPPTAKYASDGNTSLLMNNLTVTDIFDKVVLGGAGPSWIMVTSESLIGGNNFAHVSDISIKGGSFAIYNLGGLYHDYSHVSLSGTENGLRDWNNGYGTHLNHVYVNTSSFGEAAMVFNHNAGHVEGDWVFTSACGFWCWIGVDSDWKISNSLLSNNAQTIAAVNAGSSSALEFYHQQNVALDNEVVGSTGKCFDIWGAASFTDINGGCQTKTALFGVDINPSTPAPSMGPVQFIGTTWSINTGSTAAIHFVGSAKPGSPVLWQGSLINGNPISANAIPVADDLTKMSIIADEDMPPTKLFANLGTPSNGFWAYCSDCKSVADGATAGAACANSGTGSIAKRLAGSWICN